MVKGKTLAIIAIFLTIIGIIVTIAIATGFFDSSSISISGYLIGSESLSEYGPKFGYQFVNYGDKPGIVDVKISSDNKNISFTTTEITRTVPPKKTDSDYVNTEFTVNKSIFQKRAGNFTINFDIKSGNSHQTITWEYLEKCPDYIAYYSTCTYEWKK